MMRFIKFGATTALCLALIYLLSNPISSGSTTIPPIGSLVNPFSGFWQNAASTEEARTETFDLPQLSAPVKVVYDKRQVPHIFAESNKDAFFMQGYLLAQHRLWQMDIATRSAAGRLSEVIGKPTINKDKDTRRRGMVFAAENALRTWQKQPEFDMVRSYTNGVNAYIDQLSPAEYPIEFKILNYQPEHWTHLKTCLYQKNMATMLCGDQMDIELTNSVSVFGDSVIQELYPDFYEDELPVIPKNVPYDFTPVETPATTSNSIGAIHHQPFERWPKHLGSNNWAVSGSKTKSGFPILCNDPHLGLTLPSIWFELQIHTPTMNVYGVALPGIPGIVIGFNKNTAWGVTNVGQDVVDLYRINWADTDKSTYWLDGKKEKTTIKIEEIKVANAPTVYDTVRYTTWGPIAYPATKKSPEDLAMRWTTHDPVGDELRTFFELNKGNSYDNYRKAIRNFSTPPQNMVFADNNNNIGLTVQGRLPIRRKNQGMTVQVGDDSNNKWSGFIPSEQLPTVKNPERGFVASANQMSTGPDYPYPYHSVNGFEGYRGRTLVKKLEKMNNITPEDMMMLQKDVYNLLAAEALPPMLDLLDESKLDETSEKYLDILKKWDYEYKGTSAGPVIFGKWFNLFYKNTWDEIYAIDDTLKIQYPSSRLLIKTLKDNPENIYFDKKETPLLETAKDIVNLSFMKMSQQMKDLESEGNSLQLYDNKKVKINHIGFIPAFSRFDLKVEGSPRTLNAIGGAWGPSWRMIVALGKDGPTAYGIFPGGQSGNPGSPYYDNMLEDWAEGKYYELEYMK